MILTSLDVDPAELEARTGWAIKPQGACKGEICVPLPDGADAQQLSARLGMPLLHDDAHGVWALGPASVTGKALDTADAPPLTLPDVDGNDFSLETLRGKKVLLVAWASW
jgi:hypothetical protein